MPVQPTPRNWPWLKARSAGKYLGLTGKELREAAEAKVLKPGLHYQKTEHGGYIYDVHAVGPVMLEIKRISQGRKAHGLKTFTGLVKDCTRWDKRFTSLTRAVGDTK